MLKIDRNYRANQVSDSGAQHPVTPTIPLLLIVAMIAIVGGGCSSSRTGTLETPSTPITVTIEMEYASEYEAKLKAGGYEKRVITQLVDVSNIDSFDKTMTQKIGNQAKAALSFFGKLFDTSSSSATIDSSSADWNYKTATPRVLKKFLYNVEKMDPPLDASRRTSTQSVAIQSTVDSFMRRAVAKGEVAAAMMSVLPLSMLSVEQAKPKSVDELKNHLKNYSVVINQLINNLQPEQKENLLNVAGSSHILGALELHRATQNNYDDLLNATLDDVIQSLGLLKPDDPKTLISDSVKSQVAMLLQRDDIELSDKKELMSSTLQVFGDAVLKLPNEAQIKEQIVQSVGRSAVNTVNEIKPALLADFQMAIDTVGCGQPLAVAHASYGSDLGSAYYDQRTLSCDEGYHLTNITPLSSQTTIICATSGQWSTAVCSDQTAPAITGLANDPVLASNKVWTWSCDDKTLPCVFRYVVNTSANFEFTTGEAFQSVMTVTQASGLGTYYLHIQAQDAAGNTSATSHFSALIDSTVPTLAIGNPSRTQVSSRDAVDFVVTYTSADVISLSAADVVFQGALQGCTASVLAGSSSNQKTIQVTGCSASSGAWQFSIADGSATSLAGVKATASSPAASVNADNTPPVITGLTSDSTPAQNKTWTWGCVEANEPCTYRFNVGTSPTHNFADSDVFSSTTTATQSGGSGTYYLHVQAKDALGNTSTTTLVSAVLNNNAPGITIDAPNLAFVNAQDLFTFVVDYTGAASISLQNSDIVFSGASSGCSATVSGSGATTRTVTVTGCTGNGSLKISIAAETAQNNAGVKAPASGLSPATTVDNIAPASATLLINAGATRTNQSTVSLGLSATDAAAVTEMYITNTAGCGSGGAWEAFSTSKLNWTLGSTNQTTNVYAKFRDAAGNDSLCASDDILHDSTAPTIASITPPTNGSYKAGTDLSFTATLSEIADVVTTGGTPRLTLTLGSTTKYASYVSGTGTTSLIFRYTVAAGDADLDGVVLATTLDLNGGTIKDLALNPLNTGLTAPTLTGVKVDTTDPVATAMALDSNATYTSSPTVTLGFTVTDNSLAVSDMYITNTSSCGGGGSWEAYSPTKAGWTLASTNSTQTVYAKFRDAAGNESNCVSDGIIQDNTPPTATSFSVPLAGVYATGGVNDFVVTFSEIVNVTETPRLPIAVGLSTQYAQYISGSGTTALTFRYTVQAGDNDVDGVALVSPLELNGGTLKDASGNAVTLSFTSPSTSLILYDTTAPSSVTLTIAGGAGYTNQTSVALSFSASDNAAGALQMYVTNTSGCASGGSWEAFANSKPAWTLAQTNQTATVYVAVKDLAGNTSSCASGSIVHDNVAPSLSFTSPAANTEAQAAITLSGTCEDTLPITYGGAGIMASFTKSGGDGCVGGLFTQQVFLKNDSDGTKAITVSQTDLAGNPTTITRNFVRDNVAPSVAQSTLTYPHYSNTSTVVFGGSCESNYVVTTKKSSTTQGTSPCPTGSWSFTVTAETTNATFDYTFEQTDAAGNNAFVVGRWIRDTVAPTLTITSGDNLLTASNSVVFTGNCEANLPSPIAVSGAATGTVSCSSGIWTYTTPTQTTDATRTYTFTLIDQAGNATSVDGVWQRDTNVPNLTITTTNPVINGLNTASFGGACQTGFNIEIRRNGTLENTIACGSGSYTYSADTQTSDAQRSYEVKQTNAVLLTTTATIAWVRDTTGPTFADGLFSINGGAATTSSARVVLSASIVDTLSNVVALCVQVGSPGVPTAPTANSPCWVAVDNAAINQTPALTVAVSNYGFNLPITPASYTLYLWSKDVVGNISALSNSGNGTAGKDKATIEFVEAIAPILSYVLVGANDYPANPPSNTDLTVGSGSPVYIKWKASDDAALPSNPIRILYTTDEVNWTVLASNLTNGVNGACTINHASTPADDDATGCYLVTANPVSGFIKFRVTVKDTANLEAGATSQPLNVTTTMKFLAGNTDPGLNLSAKSAMFFYRRMSTDIYTPDLQTLAVTRDGVVYFKDAVRGILKVDPADGVVRSFLKLTGSSTGDGGPVSSATATLIFKIALDHSQPTQKLWIFDNNKIRRVDLATNIITTVIGGGTDNSDTVANPLNAKVDAFFGDWEYWTKWIDFFPTPNGDLYFRAGNDGYYDNNTRPVENLLRVRRYNGSTGEITSWRLTNVTTVRDMAGYTPSVGHFNYCQVQGLSFSFDPSSSAILERIGVVNRYPAYAGCHDAGNGGSWAGFDASGGSAANHPYSPRVGAVNWWNGRFSTFTGMDGRIYGLDRSGVMNGLYRYEGAPTYTWTRVVGPADYLPGACNDNTDATSCPTTISDAFVSENGTVYFLDDGLIRTINASGKVVTLMGQRQVSGFGGPLASARLGSSIMSFRLRNDGGIMFADSAHMKLDEFHPNTTLYHIAGTGISGAVTDGVDARNSYMNLEHPNTAGDDFGLDPATGDVYHHGGWWAIKKLTRASSAVGAIGQWSTFMAGGTNHWAHPSAEGSSSIRWDGDCSYGVDSGYALYSCWLLPRILTYQNGQLITHQSISVKRISDNTIMPSHNAMKLYDVSTKVQTHLLGKVGVNTTYGNAWDALSPVGTALNNLEFWSGDWMRVSLPYQLSTNPNRWLFMRFNDGNWKSIYDVTVGGTLQVYTTLADAAKNFTYRNKSGTDYIYYCSTGGNLIRRNKTAATETHLPWPIPGMTCEGRSMFYRESTQSLILVYKLNGLIGFGEYFDLM